MPRVPRSAMRMTYKFYRGRRPRMPISAAAYRFGRSASNEMAVLAAVGLRARQYTGHLARRGLADGCVLEPAGDVVVSHTLPPLDLAALGQNAFPVPRQVPEGLKRGVLPHDAAGHDHEIAHRNGKP